MFITSSIRLAKEPLALRLEMIESFAVSEIEWPPAHSDFWERHLPARGLGVANGSKHIDLRKGSLVEKKRRCTLAVRSGPLLLPLLSIRILPELVV